MKPPLRLDCEIASRILDFSGQGVVSRELADMQLAGAVALYNAIHDPAVSLGYLADEVGMGKTYVALGVVALMRFFNPALKVLFITPSENVQTKWIRDYQSFVARNVRTHANRVRGVDGESVAPYARCDSLADLIRTASSGYFADFFVRNGSFSFGLSDDPEVWKRHLESLQALLPAIDPDFDAIDPVSGDQVSLGKYITKDQYAQAINYILPDFDLVVIDEAHNFKKPFDTSDRNRVLSQVLGMGDFAAFDGDWKPKKRVKNALLLSATPFDRDLEHLRNQLALVGKRDLLPAGLKPKDEQAIHLMDRFMVRRLNRLEINGQPYTRNMYRVEWRSGPNAEIPIKSDDRRLVTALVQKKVGDLLDKKHGSPSFQMGLLASFESYAETTRSPVVQDERAVGDFDTDASDDGSGKNEAADREVVAEIADSYSDLFGVSLPHPKMDEVADRLADAMFHRGAKQLVFVRRVKSVKELKKKLDERYDTWLKGILRAGAIDHEEVEESIESIIGAYEQIRGADKQVITNDDLTEAEGDGQLLKPKNDNLFNWWFRGEAPKLDDVPSDRTPNWLRERIRGGRNLESLALEINWCGMVASRKGLTISREWVEFAWRESNPNQRVGAAIDYPRESRLLQQWFLPYLGIEAGAIASLHVDNTLPSETAEGELIDPHMDLAVLILSQTTTLYEELDRLGLLADLFPDLDWALSCLVAGQTIDPAVLERIEIHQAIMSTVLRTGHGMVDLYLAFLRASESDKQCDGAPARLKCWIRDFAVRLQSHGEIEAGFSTWRELRDLAAGLDVIIKLNLPEISDPKTSTRARYLASQLNPIAPVLAASGELNSGGMRSAQARKFRMPGYPLALVSTNVFQEGEDLHLFCDSVTHYGISNSPVSIEQKNGRVDRIGSLAQNRLRQLKRNPSDQDLIQVYFPHIIESIERLQIRQLCENMNEYIDSLQDMDASSFGADAEINADQAFRDRSGVPAQNRHLLESRFRAQVPALEKSEGCSLAEAIEGANKLAEDKRSLFEGLLKQVMHKDSSRLYIRSARASGELLLKITQPSEPAFFPEDDVDGLSQEMSLRSWQTLHRTIAYRAERQPSRIRLQGSDWCLAADAEMLLGGPGVTQLGDVQHLLHRFDTAHDPALYRPISGGKIKEMMSRLVSDGIDGGHLKIEVQQVLDPISFNSELTGRDNLMVCFPRRDEQRVHRVSLFESGEDCVLLSLCARAELVKQKRLPVSRLIELTWQRNAETDMVEFMLDPDGNLVGRCVHPIGSMHFREFEYCVHTLAAECDRLEYVVSMEDCH